MTEELKKAIDHLEDECKRIVRAAILEERDLCARTALWRMNLYTELAQQNVCKEIYSSILTRSDS